MYNTNENASSPTANSSVGLPSDKPLPATTHHGKNYQGLDIGFEVLTLPLDPLWDLFDWELMDDRIAAMILRRWDEGTIAEENIGRVVQWVVDGCPGIDQMAPPPPLTLRQFVSRYREYRDCANRAEKWFLVSEAERLGEWNLREYIRATFVYRREEMNGFRRQLEELARANSDNSAGAAGLAAVTPPSVEGHQSEQST